MLTILKFPHKILTTKTEPVTDFDEGLHAALDAMEQTMKANKGIGLAANQVGIPLSFFIMLDHKGKVWEFMNPEIIEAEGAQFQNEGCLSGPGVFVQLNRSKQITVKAQDRDGNPFTVMCLDLEAVCVQHEMDHLKGELFLDKAPRQQRKAAYSRLGLKK